MKKMFLFVLFVLLFGPSVAQDSVRSERKDRRAAVRSEMLALPRSQLAVGVGVPPSIFRQMSINMVYKDQSNDCYLVRAEDLPLFSVQYAYRVVQFLEVGGSFGYSFSTNQCFSDQGATRAIGWQEFHGFTVAAFARYAWFNSRWVSLYSSLGVVCYFEYDKTSLNGRSKGAVNTIYNLPVLPDVSLIGVRVGRRLFGYVEPLCFNGRGVLLQAGLGYKF